MLKQNENHAEHCCENFDSVVLHRSQVYSLKNSEGNEIDDSIIIVIQSDYINSTSDDTLVLFCSTNYSLRARIEFSFYLSKFTMSDYKNGRLQKFNNKNFFAFKIKEINKKQLFRFLGTMRNSFMNKLQPCLDSCIGINRSRDVNWAQLLMLSTVDMNFLLEVAKSNLSNQEKIDSFLNIFGFDMSQNGIEYLKKAILIAFKRNDFSLDLLAKTIAEQEESDASEILRLIVTMIKEHFNFKKSPALSFIRLIARLLSKDYQIWS